MCSCKVYLYENSPHTGGEGGRSGRRFERREGVLGEQLHLGMVLERVGLVGHRVVDRERPRCDRGVEGDTELVLRAEADLALAGVGRIVEGVLVALAVDDRAVGRAAQQGLVVDAHWFLLGWKGAQACLPVPLSYHTPLGYVK